MIGLAIRVIHLAYCVFSQQQFAVLNKLVAVSRGKCVITPHTGRRNSRCCSPATGCIVCAYCACVRGRTAGVRTDTQVCACVCVQGPACLIAERSANLRKVLIVNGRTVLRAGRCNGRCTESVDSAARYAFAFGF